MTTWELLALLVALRGWSHVAGIASLHVRSDSVSALRALQRGAARAPGFNRLLVELALRDALAPQPLTLLDHIPGVQNEWPDHLSRLHAPEPHTVPSGLSGVPRLALPPRSSEWYQGSRGAPSPGA